MRTFYEFFAGGGMARMGLGLNWKCAFANDWDSKKVASYIANWGDADITDKDIRQISSNDLPNQADLVWSSFPCQDLSLAGKGKGLKGERSGVFWSFWSLMEQLQKEGRKPRTLVIENVVGLLTSNKGQDFSAVCDILSKGGYRFGAVVINADLFVPQSRPRLFFIAVDESLDIPTELTWLGAVDAWHPKALKKAYRNLAPSVAQKWIWWLFPSPSPRNINFIDILEPDPQDVDWHTPAQTEKLIAMMSKVNLEKIERKLQSGERVVGGVYKRTRTDEYGKRVQRAEVRFDNIAGCLRTPGGGSSRQIIVLLEDNKIKSRLLSAREGARLMGLPDSYILPEKYNEAYHLVGDGVVVPVVSYLKEQLFEPILAGVKKTSAATP